MPPQVCYKILLLTIWQGQCRQQRWYENVWGNRTTYFTLLEVFTSPWIREMFETMKVKTGSELSGLTPGMFEFIFDLNIKQIRNILTYDDKLIDNIWSNWLKSYVYIRGEIIPRFVIFEVSNILEFHKKYLKR